jgi:hypothetical protein
MANVPITEFEEAKIEAALRKNPHATAVTAKPPSQLRQFAATIAVRSWW